MIYTPLTKKAMILACRAHEGQVDKSGLPYIHHPLHLAEQMEDELTTCVALLHDVVEDTEVTFEDLKDFPQEVLAALRLLTHDPEISYLDYVRKIAEDPVAKAVKIADLNHNRDLTRLNAVTPRDLARAEKYAKAFSLLTE